MWCGFGWRKASHMNAPSVLNILRYAVYSRHKVLAFQEQFLAWGICCDECALTFTEVQSPSYFHSLMWSGKEDPQMDMTMTMTMTTTTITKVLQRMAIKCGANTIFVTVLWSCTKLQPLGLVVFSRPDHVNLFANCHTARKLEHHVVFVTWSLQKLGYINNGIHYTTVHFWYSTQVLLKQDLKKKPYLFGCFDIYCPVALTKSAGGRFVVWILLTLITMIYWNCSCSRECTDKQWLHLDLY